MNVNKSNVKENKRNEKKGGKKIRREMTAMKKTRQREKPVLKVVPLGGLREIGKNITAIEYGNDILLIDCGACFPDDDMFGIDLVIPDFTYLKENRQKIKGLVITHGHEDHIGGVPYLIKEMSIPVYGTRLPLGLIQNKLDEHGLKAKLRKFEVGDTIKLGCFRCEAIRVTHSIADSICLAIDTPVGRIFHTGDFKVDYTPVDGEPIDLAYLAELGKKGVMLMMSDSTNAVREGYTRSEKLVGKTLDNIFATSNTRILIATFSSNVHRIQKIIDNAADHKRKVAVSGRSMENVVRLAEELGYLRIPKGIMVDINETKNIPDNKLVIITTGSQGEPMSALARMASSEHKAIEIKPGDKVVLSSTPVPGNEKMVSNVVDKLIEKGADVIYSDIADTHVSGHACKEELKLMLSLIKPKFFMPVHGEYRHLKAHSDIAAGLGKNRNDIFILNNGDCLTLNGKRAKVIEDVAPAGGINIDGLGVGDVGNIVLRDRRLLSEGGLIIVAAAMDRVSRQVVSGPDLISRGFVYVRENEDLMEEAAKVAAESLAGCERDGVTDWNTMKTVVRDDLRRFLYSKTGRNPVILPIFMEV